MPDDLPHPDSTDKIKETPVMGTVYFGAQPLEPRSEQTCRPGAILANQFFHIADKARTGGIEPGHIVVELTGKLIFELIREGILPDDVVTSIKGFETTNINEKSIDEILQTENKKNMVSNIKDEVNKLYKSKKNADKLEKLHDFLSTLDPTNKEKYERDNGHPVYLIKQDYPDSMRTPIDNLTKTSAGGELSKAALIAWHFGSGLKKGKESENKKAFSEVTANAIAHVLGMPTQKQDLLFGRYGNGSLKVLTIAGWEKKAEKLPFVDGKAEPFGRSGEWFSLMMVQADRDAIGSQAQNKLKIGEDLFGIDFGHAYQYASGENVLIGNIIIDEKSKNVSVDVPENFKNYKVILDSPVDQKIKSLLYLYQSLSEDDKISIFSDHPEKKDILDNYIEQFKKSDPDHFKVKIELIKPGAVNHLIAEYDRKIDGMIRDMSSEVRNKRMKENIRQLQGFRKKLKEIKEKHNDSAKNLLKKCNDFILIVAPQVLEEKGSSPELGRQGGRRPSTRG